MNGTMVPCISDKGWDTVNFAMPFFPAVISKDKRGGIWRNGFVAKFSVDSA